MYFVAQREKTIFGVQFLRGNWKEIARGARGKVFLGFLEDIFEKKTRVSQFPAGVLF